MKTAGKLFITDFDRTLLKDDRTISQEDIKTLEFIRQKKIFTGIATGRSVYSFNKALKDIGLPDNRFPIDYVMFSTGAGIMEFQGGKIIYQKAIPAPGIRKITDYLDHGKFDYMVHKSIPDTHCFFYKSNGEGNSDFYHRIALYKEYALPMEKGHFPKDPATEVLAILKDPVDMDTLGRIKKDLSDFSVIHATSPLDHKSSWIEIFHKDVSKSSAASWLAKRLCLNRKNVLSVGNDYNDQDLLSWSGKGFVVNNAPDSLKRSFETVRSNNRCGVSEAIAKAGWII